MFSTMNLALVAVAILLVGLLFKLKKDKAAAGGAPAKKAPRAKSARAGRPSLKMSVGKRGGAGGGRGRGRGKAKGGRAPQVAEAPAHDLAQHQTPSADPALAMASMAAASAPQPTMPQPVPAYDGAVAAAAVAQPGWPTATVEQPGWPTASTEQPGWPTPDQSFGLAPSYNDAQTTGPIPAVGGPLADPAMSAPVAMNGNGSYGAHTAAPAEWSDQQADPMASWNATPAAPEALAPAPWQPAEAPAANDWESWSADDSADLGAAVPNAVPEQWSQEAAPVVPDSTLPPLDMTWDTPAETVAIEAAPAPAPISYAQEWETPAPEVSVPAIAEPILDDFGFPIEDPAAVAPAPAPAQAAEPEALPAIELDTEPVALDYGSDFSEPVVETRAAAPSVPAAPALDALPEPAPIAEPHLEWEPPVAAVPAETPTWEPEPASVPAATSSRVTAPVGGAGDAWWDDAPEVIPSLQSGRFALGGHALRAGQEALTGVTFREAFSDDEWDAASDANRAARIQLTLEGAVNCSPGGVEVVSDPGFAPTEDGFTVRLVAEEAGPFMASGTYRVV